MNNRRIRHFPLVLNRRLCGIGDMVKGHLDEIEYEEKSLRSFIAGGLCEGNLERKCGYEHSRIYSRCFSLLEGTLSA